MSKVALLTLARMEVERNIDVSGISGLERIGPSEHEMVAKFLRGLERLLMPPESEGGGVLRSWMVVGTKWMRRKAGDTEAENERVGRVNV